MIPHDPNFFVPPITEVPDYIRADGTAAHPPAQMPPNSLFTKAKTPQLFPKIIFFCIFARSKRLVLVTDYYTKRICKKKEKPITKPPRLLSLR